MIIIMETKCQSNGSLGRDAVSCRWSPVKLQDFMLHTIAYLTRRNDFSPK